MRSKFWLIIGLFVLGLAGCFLPETSANNHANEPIAPQANTSPENAPDALPGSTPRPKTARKYAGVAVGSRQLWPEAVNTPESFDRASRAAILFYALELDARKTPESKTANSPSVAKWLAKELNLAERNYRAAAANCKPNDWTCIGAWENPEDFIRKGRALRIPANFDAWQDNIDEFTGVYVAEQLRLAKIFPTTSSEIDFFNENEWSGDEDAARDRQFFLTFDDGPTASGGNTDAVAAMLRAEKKTAVFFVLGQRFAARQKADGALEKLYEGQCVAAHGWEHLSHEKRSKYALGNKWQTSVTDTLALVKNSFADDSGILPLFRPPYGQRKADSGAFFQKEGVAVALWNLDSQDWQAQVTAADIVNRIEILMLIKRRGVLLFHDIHPKAAEAVPAIIKDFGSAVEWGDCRRIGK